ncbi:MAG: hypothetical protein LBE12_04075 [Planctomycetaceae bacterium]|nr:hypothetical protein [Planctomycetaceae bacterium]
MRVDSAASGMITVLVVIRLRHSPLSTLNYQLSTINSQLSTINYYLAPRGALFCWAF